MTRSYKTQEDVLEELEVLVSELRVSGVEFFPSERHLCKEFGASRETVRRGLEILEDREVLIKGVKGRIISPQRKNGPNVVYVSTGEDTVVHPAWAKLWGKLSQLAANEEFNLSLSLFGWSDNEKAFSELFENIPDIVIYSSAPNEEIEKRIFDLRDKTCFIVVNEQFEDECDYCVSLDNFAAGELAAELLFNAGYKKPAFLARMLPDYTPFVKRANGFKSKLKELGMNFGKDAFNYFESDTQTQHIRRLISITEKLSEKDFDSLFFYSDEHCTFVYEILSEKHNIPEDFGLVALAGSGESLRNNPPISSVSHAAEKVASKLIDLIPRIANNEKTIPKKILLKPGIIEGETLRKI